MREVTTAVELTVLTDKEKLALAKLIGERYPTAERVDIPTAKEPVRLPLLTVAQLVEILLEDQHGHLPPEDEVCEALWQSMPGVLAKVSVAPVVR